MGDAPKEHRDQRGHGAKRKATENAVSAGTPLALALLPTQHPPPPILSPRSSFQTPAGRDLSKPASLASKVAIPRLPRPSGTTSPIGSIKTGDKHRVTHACEPCRHRKTKCSGERPSCKHCDDFKITCTYADGKRDRVKKEYHHMMAKLEAFEKLLVEISPCLDTATQSRIRRTIEKELASDDDEAQSLNSLGKVSFSNAAEEPDGESQVSAGAGSTGSLDRINEDFNRNHSARATGFMGKLSDVTWLHRLRDQLEDASPPTESIPFGHLSGTRLHENSSSSQFILDDGIADSTYHCDDLAILAPDQVEPFEHPPRQVVEFLLQTYLESVHPSFPIIGKVNFCSQVQNYLDRDHVMPGKNWLAILNLIFAIAAKYSHLVQSESRGDERDHIIYFTRARLLSMDGDWILSQPELQRIQIAGLMSFYLMSINQINRSWTLCGLAIRYSVALGLHLRNENPKVPDSNKEIRYRVWWAIYGLERNLGVITGRPTAFAKSDCMTPVPLPIDEESFNDPSSGMQSEEMVRQMRRFSNQDSPRTISPSSSGPSPRNRQSPTASNSPGSQQPGFDFFKNAPPSQALYFTQVTYLSMITHDILGDLYRPSATLKSWSQIQSIIADLDRRLERWKMGLPALFDFAKRQRDQHFIRQRMSLGFCYFSAKIITNRPCLCRVDRRIPNESNKSKAFCRNAAATCVQAAKSMLDLIPDEPNPVGLYKVTPWWCLTHHLTQAGSVLLLELFFQSGHMPNEAQDVLDSAKKAVHWLNKMARGSLAAQRAWRQCDELLRKVAPRIGMHADDMPTEAPCFGGSFTPVPTHMEGPMDGWSRPHQPAQQFREHFLYSDSPQDSDHTFHPTIHNSFDEYLPFDHSMPNESMATTAGVSLSSLFPTTTEMGHFAMGGETRHGYGHDYAPNHSWDSMGGQG